MTATSIGGSNSKPSGVSVDSNPLLEGIGWNWFSNLSIVPFYKHPLVVYVFSFGGLAIHTFGKNVTFVSGLGLQQRHVM